MIPLVVAIGGAFGALARYGVGVLLPHDANGFPWRTLLINLTGSFLLGFGNNSVSLLAGITRTVAATWPGKSAARARP